MSKNRIKITMPEVLTRADAETTVGRITHYKAREIELNAQMDAEIAAVRERYQTPLSEVQVFLQASMESLQVWAEANPNEFPKDRKSIDMVQGVVGFRTGTPKLEVINRKWTWAKVLAALVALNSYVRKKSEVDKEKILSDHAAGKVSDNGLALIGVKVVQDETFFVEPKLTEVETRHTAEAA